MYSVVCLLVPWIFSLIYFILMFYNLVFFFFIYLGLLLLSTSFFCFICVFHFLSLCYIFTFLWFLILSFLSSILRTGITQWYSARLRTGWSWVRVPTWGGNLSPHHRVQNGSGIHPASHPMGTRDSFPGSKAAESWSWPLASTYCRGQECVKL
jgi:hypothetical protein